MRAELAQLRAKGPRFPLPRYPTGWFFVAFTEELKVGDVRAIEAFGQELVLFRGADGAAALLDAHRLGLEVTVFASIKLSEHGTQALPEFEDVIASFEEVVEAYAMTGEVDYLLKVVTRDIQAYESFLRNDLLQQTTVREVHSQIALKSIKNTTRLPLSRMLREER